MVKFTALQRHTMQTVFLVLFDFLYAKPFLTNNIRKKTKTNQVRTLKEGNQFQIKSKSSPLHAGLCMMAHVSGQSSEIERLQTSLDVCLYRAKPEA